MSRTAYLHDGVTIDPAFPIPDMMKAWVLGNPEELSLIEKSVPVPKRAEVLVRVDAIAICATDLDVISSGPPAMIQGGLPFNKNFTPGHEYMGTVVALGPGVDEFAIGDRITVEIHAGCGQCKRCRMGMYTSCHNYGLNYGDVDKGHRANGFTSDGGFAEYAVNNINTLIKISDEMSDEEATLVVTAGTGMYGLTELGGLIAGAIADGETRRANRRSCLMYRGWRVVEVTDAQEKLFLTMPDSEREAWFNRMLGSENPEGKSVTRWNNDFAVTPALAAAPPPKP